MDFNKCKISPNVSVDYVKRVESPKHYKKSSDIYLVGPENKNAPKQYYVCHRSSTSTNPDLELYQVRIKLNEKVDNNGPTKPKKRKT